MSAEFAPKKVANLLRELFGRAVKVDTADLLTMSPVTTSWVAVYGGNTGKTTGVCVRSCIRRQCRGCPVPDSASHRQGKHLVPEA